MPRGDRSTDGVSCNIDIVALSLSLQQMSEAKWSCHSGVRRLEANGLPDHEIGTFPNEANPNTPTQQDVRAVMPLAPALSDTTRPVGGPGGVGVFALNGVKFDPGTGGTCPEGAGEPGDCPLGGAPAGEWRIEALGQDVFDFGEDWNNAHVQPTGAYHYHGVPEGVLRNLGISDGAPRMGLVGWATDGFPVYARWCHADAGDPDSPIKRCEGSYELKARPDAGRPSTDWVPMGAFGQDWTYAPGSGDLDECNGRFGVTPDFPEGIYHYMATDDYPYFSRCLKGVVLAQDYTVAPREAAAPLERGERGSRPPRGRGRR